MSQPSASETCPVEAVGRRIAELMRRQDVVLDQMDALPKESSARAKLGDVCEDIGEACATLTDHAAILRPVSLAGCMVQIIAALSECDVIASNSPEYYKDTSNKIFRGIQRRLVHTVVHLSRVSGVSPNEIGGSWNFEIDKDAHTSFDGFGPLPMPIGQTSEPTAEEGLVVVQDEGAGPDATECFATVERQLLAWAAQYELTDKLYGKLSHEEELRFGSGKGGEPGDASHHANRMNREAVEHVMALRASSLRELGIKARVAADRCSDWWQGDTPLDSGEELLKSLVDDVLSAAGVARIPRSDMSEDDLRYRLRTGEFRDRTREAIHAEASTDKAAA